MGRPVLNPFRRELEAVRLRQGAVFAGDVIGRQVPREVSEWQSNTSGACFREIDANSVQVRSKVRG